MIETRHFSGSSAPRRAISAARGAMRRAARAVALEIGALSSMALATAALLLAATPAAAQNTGAGGTSPDTTATRAASPTATPAAAPATPPATAPSAGQPRADAADSGPHLPVRLSGHASMTGELYTNHGAQARRPGESWRMALSPQATLFGQVTVGIDLLLSSEGADFRQNINQYGISPSWRWGTVHLGDFSQGYSAYTIQGIRIRGAGLDLRPGVFRLSIQGGRTQRTVLTGGETAFRRNLIAARLGVGRESGSYIGLHLVSARDDMSAEERELIVVDSTLVDTIFDPFQPRIDTRPQENLVAGLNTQFALFHGALRIRAEAAGSLLNNDLTSPRANLDGAQGEDALRLVDRIHPIRLSTSGDLAVNGEATLDLRNLSLRGGYESIGTGYNSLGLAYLIGDRRAYHAGGGIRLWESRLALQGQVQHQHDNLLGQKLTTTSRNTANLNLVLRLNDAVTTSVAGLSSNVGNDAAADSLDSAMQTRALMLNTAVQGEVGGRPAVLNLGYNLQRVANASALIGIPGVVVHQLSTSIQLNLTPAVSLAPTLSAALTRTDGEDDDRTIMLGFRGQARVLDGKLTTGANLSQSYNMGREILNAGAQATLTLPWESRLALQSRFNRYGAFGNRPGFREFFTTLTLSRSF